MHVCSSSKGRLKWLQPQLLNWEGRTKPGQSMIKKYIGDFQYQRWWLAQVGPAFCWELEKGNKIDTYKEKFLKSMESYEGIRDLKTGILERGGAER